MPTLGLANAHKEVLRRIEERFGATVTEEWPNSIWIRPDRRRFFLKKHNEDTKKYIRADLHEDLVKACEAFIEAYEKSHQIEKTDVAVRMAKAALNALEGR